MATRYSGGGVVWVDNLNRDYMSKFDFDDFAKHWDTENLLNITIECQVQSAKMGWKVSWLVKFGT